MSATSTDIPWFLRLYAQVIRRAVVDYVLYYGHPMEKLGQIGDEAYAWLFNDNRDFVEVCSYLDIAPYAIREQTLGMSEEDARALRGLDFEDDPVGV